MTPTASASTTPTVTQTDDAHAVPRRGHADVTVVRHAGQSGEGRSDLSDDDGGAAKGLGQDLRRQQRGQGRGVVDAGSPEVEAGHAGGELADQPGEILPDGAGGLAWMDMDRDRTGIERL